MNNSAIPRNENHKTVIIDVGIDVVSFDKYAKSTCFLVVHDRMVCAFDGKKNQHAVSHGGLCMDFFVLGANKVPSYFILLNHDSQGRCCVDDLVVALEWCVEANASLVSLSMGSTYYRDAAKLSGVVEWVSQKGVCLIAGASNEGLLSYPACFEGCIGVCVDHSLALGISGYAYMENSFDGIEIVINPLIAGEQLGSNSMATAYFSGMISRLILDTGVERGRVKEWLATMADCVDPRSLWAFRAHSLGAYPKPPLGDVIIIAVYGMTANSYTAQFCHELQNCFLTADYLCTAIFSERYYTGESRYALYQHFHTDDRLCSYEDFVKLVVQLCQPNAILVEWSYYGNEIDVLLCQNTPVPVVNDGTLVIDINANTLVEVFESIIRFFGGE